MESMLGSVIIFIKEQEAFIFESTIKVYVIFIKNNIESWFNFTLLVDPFIDWLANLFVDADSFISLFTNFLIKSLVVWFIIIIIINSWWQVYYM